MRKDLRERVRERERDGERVINLPFFLAKIKYNHQRNPLVHVLLVHTLVCICPFQIEAVIPVTCIRY